MAQHNLKLLSHLNYEYVHFLSILITKNIFEKVNFTKLGVHAIVTLQTLTRLSSKARNITKSGLRFFVSCSLC